MAKRFWKHNGMTFFLILFGVSLFIPQHIQGLLEVYWALALFLILLKHPTTIPFQIPRNFTTLYGVVLLTLMLTAIHSKSISASVYAIVRYLEGFLLFLLAGNFREQPEPVADAVVWTGRIIVGMFLLFLVFPQTTAFFPQYNSILAVNGHHPVAYLLIALIPLIFSPKTIRPRWVQTVDYALIAIGVVASMARSAWIIILIYLFIELLRKNTLYRTTTLLISLFLVASFLATGMWLSHTPLDQQPAALRRFLPLAPYARDLQKDLRAEFIAQAVRALKDSPFIGHGPGTFHLISRQYQGKPATSTRNTHSFFFETLAENGMIGSIPLFLLFAVTGFSLVRVAAKEKNPAKSALSKSALLLLLYSSFEVTFNVIPLWLLFWALSGYLLVRKKRPDRTVVGAGFTPLFIGLLPVAVFLVSFLASFLFSAAKQQDAALMIAPYRKDLAIAAIQHTKAPVSAAMFAFWYRNDPDILFALAQRDGGPTSLPYYRQAFQYDPYNTAYLGAYLIRLVTDKQYTEVRDVLCAIAKKESKESDRFCEYTQSLAFDAYTHMPSSFIEAISNLSGADGLAKFYYLLGLDLYNRLLDPWGATHMMRVARDIAPQWGFYHLELASTQLYGEGDDVAAKETYTECLHIPLAKIGCERVNDDLTNLPLPGTHKRDIIAIPNVLPL